MAAESYHRDTVDDNYVSQSLLCINGYQKETYRRDGLLTPCMLLIVVMYTRWVVTKHGGTLNIWFLSCSRIYSEQTTTAD